VSATWVGAEVETQVVTVAELDVGSYAEDDPRLFPWSAASLHEETYDDADHDEWQTQCVIDNGVDRFVTETPTEWAEARLHGQLRTCANGAGEVDFWRFELNLDDRGRSFLALLDFALRVGIRPIAEFVRSPRVHSNSIDVRRAVERRRHHAPLVRVQASGRRRVGGRETRSARW
jgi:hypothetical protein